MPTIDVLRAAMTALRPAVDAHVTPERIRRYVRAIADTPAPSTAASAFRLPVLARLLSDDGALTSRQLHLLGDFENTGSTVILTGSTSHAKPLWIFAHLDTVSYLVQQRQGARYPLVPFCYHLMADGSRNACAWRFDMILQRYVIVASGWIDSDSGVPSFRPVENSRELGPGDRVVFSTPYREDAASGDVFAHVDNAGAVAALAVAAPVLAEAGIDALLAFPDEEEGPSGSGSQTMGRGGTRIVGSVPAPDLAIIADVQQAGGMPVTGIPGNNTNTTRLGQGVVLAEFSSLSRGAVTPPHLYGILKLFASVLAEMGVPLQESNNAYTSRSDDVGVLLKTPHIALLGFPGFNRHFDHGEPHANLRDIVALSKALIYVSAVTAPYRRLRDSLTGG